MSPATGPGAGRATALPRARVRPPQGWLNDPHGAVRWGGRWHVFFQLNPDSAAHGQICWGHASSADLVVWDDEPVALRPTPGGLDGFGCWTGCLTVDGDTAVIAYTAVETGPETATVTLATSADADLGEWVKLDEPVARAPEGVALRAFRDPYLVEVGGRRLAVVGAGGVPDGTGSVLLYDATDLRRWRHLGTLLDTTDEVAAEVAPGDVWECPQLFPLGDRWVLVISLVSEPHRGRVVHLTGRLEADGDSWRLRPETGGLVDHGHDFYAPTVLPGSARTLLWGWATEDRPQADSDALGWSGALTVVRELSLADDGSLRSVPVAELAERRAEPEVRDLVAGDLLTLPSGPAELVLEGVLDGPVVVDLLGEIGLRIGDDEVALLREAGDPYRAAWRTTGRRTAGAAWTVRVVVDASVVEVYVDDGPCFTERVYGDGQDVTLLAGRCHAAAYPLSLG